MLDLFFEWGDRFELVNPFSQPVSDCGFGFFECSQTIVRVESESLIIERDVPAGDSLAAAIGRNKVHQETFAARRWMVAFLMVHASGGVFKDELRSPWRAGTVPVSSVF
jgi:hypothetical protein